MLNYQQLKPLQSLITGLFFKHKHILLMLPRQEGKTELGVRLMHNLISERVHTRQGLFLAKSKEAGKKAIREKMARIFSDADFDVNTLQIVNKANRNSICFMDSVDKQPSRLRGGSYHLVHWSEVAFSEFDHGVTVDHVYNTVIRPTQRATYGYSYLETTANGKNGWYDLWENAENLGFHRIRFSLSQLVDIGLVSAEEYDRLKSTMPGLEFAQEYECEFVTFQGLTYEEMKEGHIWPQMPDPQPWQNVVAGIDWGWQPSATCVLFAYIKQGRVCIFDEIYGQKIRLEDLEAQIRAKLSDFGVGRFSAVGDHDPAKIEELVRHGIAVAPANKANVLGQRMQIKTLFKNDRLYIHPRCSNLIRDLQSATWDPKKEGDIQYSNCTWGHYDGEAAIRYLIRELSTFESGKEPEPLPVTSLERRVQRLKAGI
jgi:hypothetical protein